MSLQQHPFPFLEYHKQLSLLDVYGGANVYGFGHFLSITFVKFIHTLVKGVGFPHRTCGASRDLRNHQILTNILYFRK